MDNKVIYAINVGDFTLGETVYENRCLSASFGGSGVSSETIPWEDAAYNPWDYKYEDGQFTLDPIPIPEEDQSKAYSRRVVELIRERYTIEDELAIQRQRDTKPEEFQAYFDYVEECKEQAKE